MTDPELDNARAAEAFRLWGEDRGTEDAPGLEIAATAARLAREGWDPGSSIEFTGTVVGGIRRYEVRPL